MYPFVRREELLSKYLKYLPTPSWWASVQHGIVLTGLLAPLTALDDVGTVYIPSTNSPEFDSKYPWGSCPDIDNNISWSDVKVVHDGYELSRQEKIKYIKDNYIQQGKKLSNIKVCSSSTVDGNCGRCFKCYQTMVGLLLEGLNPNEYGFSIDTESLELVKQYIIKSKFDPDEYSLWRDIQTHIPEKIERDLHGSYGFFNWFKDFGIREASSPGK